MSESSGALCSPSWYLHLRNIIKDDDTSLYSSSINAFAHGDIETLVNETVASNTNVFRMFHLYSYLAVINLLEVTHSAHTF